jgi:uncharacterized protein (TIGR00290 family)
MEKAALFWSGGKDSAYALFLASKSFDIKYLVTTFSDSSKRVTMHGINEKLLERQVKETNIPLKKMWFKEGEYEKSIEGIFNELKSEGIKHVIFGDIFLEDLKTYRESLIKKHDMKGVFPLWGKDTGEMFKEIRKAGFDAILCCVDKDLFEEDVTGKSLWEVPMNNIDPCGENGEYHTFCHTGPIFLKPVPFELGEKVEMNYQLLGKTKTFIFRDLL